MNFIPVSGGVWTNYSFSNCQIGVLNNSVHYINVSFQQLNASGLLCSISANFPWFWIVFMLALYVATLLLFSYLQTLKLLVVTNSLIFGFATILLSYGFIGPGVWFGVFGIEVVTLAAMWMTNQR